MSILTCIETYIDNDKNHYGCFVIEPLETGQGITLGNALRRTLLSDLTGFAISGVRINDLKHEFSIVEGLREDILEVLLNLKQVIFKNSTLLSSQNSDINLKGFLQIKGPTIITAGMFNLPKDLLKIINPNHYICTIVDNSEFYIEIDIENGKGYKLTEENRKNKNDIKFSKSKPSTLLVDSIFMPIKRVNYKIKLIHDSFGNIRESLILEVWTNGSISPRRSIKDGIKILMNLFYPLFLNENFLNLSSELTMKNFKT